MFFIALLFKVLKVEVWVVCVLIIFLALKILLFIIINMFLFVFFLLSVMFIVLYKFKVLFAFKEVVLCIVFISMIGFVECKIKFKKYAFFFKVFVLCVMIMF